MNYSQTPYALILSENNPAFTAKLSQLLYQKKIFLLLFENTRDYFCSKQEQSPLFIIINLNIKAGQALELYKTLKFSKNSSLAKTPVFIFLKTFSLQEKKIFCNFTDVALFKSNNPAQSSFTTRLDQYLKKPSLNSFLKNFSSQNSTPPVFEQEHARLKKITEVIADYIYTVKVENKKVKSTVHGPGCFEVTGYSQQDFENNPFLWLNMVFAEDKIFVLEQAQKALTGKCSEPFEHRLYHKNGEIIWVRNTLVFHKDDRGKLLSYDGVIHDITQQKEALEAVEKSHAVLLAIFDSIDEPVYVADIQNYEILFANNALVKSFGSYKNKKCYKYLQGLDEPCSFCTNKKITNEYLGKSYIWEFQNKVTGKWYRCIDKIISWPDKRSVRYEMALDITEKVNTENERKLLQEQLAQSQKMESIGRLAGGVAHDFNNMLSVIMGQTEMAMNTLPDDNVIHKRLTEVRKAAKRSANLTGQLLAFARKQTVSPKILDLNETVEKMLIMLRRMIGENIDLIWLPGKNLGSVKIDPSQLDSILANLCVNARDAINDTGKVYIETQKIPVDESFFLKNEDPLPGEYIMLAVSDTGSGMTKEIKSHLFEPFFTTKKLGQGTGLGLATIWGIIKQNKGFIRIYSEPGHGSTFKIYLPCHLPVNKERKQFEHITTKKFEPKTILLVEDEPMILEMIENMLTNMGFIILSAKDPQDALSLAQAKHEKIDLVFTDVIMPSMNGKDLFNKIKNINPHIKCLFMSGYTADVIAHHGVLLEGVHFIQKPFSKKNLLIKIQETLN